MTLTHTDTEPGQYSIVQSDRDLFLRYGDTWRPLDNRHAANRTWHELTELRPVQLVRDGAHLLPVQPEGRRR